MLADRLDIFSRRPRTRIEAGSTYLRRANDQTVETAEVHSVAKDEMGIDHVRFHIKIARGHTKFVDEERILSLASFAERFRERAQA
jgi:Holliday junction resolvase